MSLNFYFGYKLSRDFGKSILLTALRCAPIPVSLPYFCTRHKMCTDTGILYSLLLRLLQDYLAPFHQSEQRQCPEHPDGFH